MNRWSFLLCVVFLPCVSGVSNAQSPISFYAFDGDLTNASSFMDKNGVEAPDGILRQGLVSSTAQEVASPVFGLGVDGTIDGALVLNGSNQWLDITTNGHPGETVQPGGASGPGLVSGTVMAWVKMDAPANGTSQWLMGSSNSTGFQSWRMGWNGTQLEAEAHADDLASSEFAISDSSNNNTWSDGEWRHLAVRWDGFSSVDEAQFYVDGVPVGALVEGSSLTAANAQVPWEFSMAIGAWNNGGLLEGFWNGRIDDVQIFAEALTDSQVETIYSSVNIAVEPDFDSDGDVDGADFLTWQRGFQTGTTFAEGDANGDMAVDDFDLVLWQRSFGNVAAEEVSAVPEPASLGLVVLGAFMALTTVRRHKTVAA